MTERRRVVAVNLAFRPQRVTGQQRYAAEIADRLLGERGFVGAEPLGWWAASALRAWLWTLLVLPIAQRRRVLVSLTSRAPVWHPRHVLVIHDLFVLTNPEWFSKRYVWTHAPLLRLQLATAKALIAVSEPVAAELRRRYPRTPVEVAPNAPAAVFLRRADDADSAVLERLGLTAGGYLLVVGSRDPRKNLARLGAAYASLEPAERAALPLVLVGGGDAIYRSESIEWPSETVAAGYVTDDALRALYAGSRAVGIVSLAEGFGLPIVEALAAGADRLLLSDLDVFRWICGPHAIYVDPERVDSIAEGIRAVARDRAELASSIDVTAFDWANSARVVGRRCRAVGGEIAAE